MESAQLRRSFWVALLGLGVLGTAAAQARWEFAFDRGFELCLSGVDSNGNQDTGIGECTTRTRAFEYRINGNGRSINVARGNVLNETGQFARFRDFPCDVWHPLDDAFGPSTRSYQAVSRSGRTLVICSGTELFPPE